MTKRGKKQNNDPKLAAYVERNQVNSQSQQPQHSQTLNQSIETQLVKDHNNENDRTLQYPIQKNTRSDSCPSQNPRSKSSKCIQDVNDSARNSTNQSESRIKKQLQSWQKQNNSKVKVKQNLETQQNSRNITPNNKEKKNSKPSQLNISSQTEKQSLFQDEEIHSSDITSKSLQQNEFYSVSKGNDSHILEAQVQQQTSVSNLQTQQIILQQQITQDENKMVQEEMQIPENPTVIQSEFQQKQSKKTSRIPIHINYEENSQNLAAVNYRVDIKKQIKPEIQNDDPRLLNFEKVLSRCLNIFPFPIPYESQVKSMKEIIKSLLKQENIMLQSPTGTGKTLITICAALAVSEERTDSQIMLLTRTTEQINGFIKELRKIKNFPEIGKYAILSGRRFTCIKGKEIEKDYDQSKLQGGTKVNLASYINKSCQTYQLRYKDQKDKDKSKFIQKQSAFDIFQNNPKFVQETYRKRLNQLGKEKQVSAEKEKILKKQQQKQFEDQSEFQLQQQQQQSKALEQQQKVEPTCEHYEITQEGLQNKSERERQRIFSGKTTVKYPQIEKKQKNDDGSVSNHTVLELPDIEDMLELFESEELGCPYFHNRLAVFSAKIVFCCYKYLLDFSIIQQIQKMFKKKKMIIIFDEAHNISEQAEQELKQELSCKSWNKLEVSLKVANNLASPNSTKDSHPIIERKYFKEEVERQIQLEKRILKQTINEKIGKKIDKNEQKLMPLLSRKNLLKEKQKQNYLIKKVDVVYLNYTSFDCVFGIILDAIEYGASYVKNKFVNTTYLDPEKTEENKEKQEVDTSSSCQMLVKQTSKEISQIQNEALLEQILTLIQGIQTLICKAKQSLERKYQNIETKDFLGSEESESESEKESQSKSDNIPSDILEITPLNVSQVQETKLSNNQVEFDDFHREFDNSETEDEQDIIRLSKKLEKICDPKQDELYLKLLQLVTNFPSLNEMIKGIQDRFVQLRQRQLNQLFSDLRPDLKVMQKTFEIFTFYQQKQQQLILKEACFLFNQFREIEEIFIAFGFDKEIDNAIVLLEKSRQTLTIVSTIVESCMSSLKSKDKLKKQHMINVKPADKILRFYKLLSKLHTLHQKGMPHKELHDRYFAKKIIEKDQMQSIIFEIGCLTAEKVFRNILKNLKVSSIIITSGTLEPFELIQKSINLQFNTHAAEPIIDSTKNVFTQFVSQSPTGVKIDLSYRFMQNNQMNKQMIKSTTESVLQIIEIFVEKSNRHNCKGGVVIFFKNYQLLETFNVSLHRAIDHRNVLINVYTEGRDAGRFKYDFEKYKNDISTNKENCLFLAVNRGKISEGIDLKDALCRAVILVGIPYQNVSDPFTKCKMRHAEEQFQESEWLEKTTTKVVNQAAGRCIRYREDWGCIFFVEANFSSRSSIYDQISPWIIKGIKAESANGEATWIDLFSQFLEEKISLSKK